MSKEIKIRIIDDDCRLNGEVSQTKDCVYCGLPTVAYTWCRKCMIKMAVIKKTIQIALLPPKEDDE